jgi:hypothetical protein
VNLTLEVIDAEWVNPTNRWQVGWLVGGELTRGFRTPNGVEDEVENDGRQLWLGECSKKELKDWPVAAIKRLMNLDDAQRSKVGEWIAQGMKLSDIQARIASELGLKMTYMDVRLLVDDLKLTPKDPDTAKPVSAMLETASTSPPAPRASSSAPPAAAAEPAGLASSVSVQVDQLARPGAVVSGKVKFSDGNMADWYFDQMGRLGLVPQKPGYRPPASDLQQFQSLLDSELSKMGF